METPKPIDPHSILSKTTLGLLQAKSDDRGDLNYDAVRLLRLVDGTTSIAELRSQFEDLTDTRFEKAVAALARNGLIRMLSPYAEGTDESASAHGADQQMRDVAQECLQTLDFTALKRELMEAMRTQDLKAAAAKSAEVRGSKPPEAPLQKAATRTQTRLDAKARAEVAAALRSKVEEELRAELKGALRPKVEEELRHQLVAMLRPVLETEIRTKLTALKARAELEVRALSEQQSARVTPHKATTGETVSHRHLLDNIEVAVFQIDGAAKIVYVNRAWSWLSGHSCEIAVGRTFAQFFAAQDQEGVTAYLEGVARGKTTPSVITANLTRKVGAPVRVRLRAAPLGMPGGGAGGLCGTLREIDKTQ